MVLMMARWDTGICERQPKTRSRESWKTTLESQGTKLENRHSDSPKNYQFTLPQGKMKKEDDVADEDDDAIRTSLTRHCILRNCSSALSIYVALSTHQTIHMWGDWRIQTVSTIHLEVPAWFHNSQLDIHAVYKVSDKREFSVQLFCYWGRR
jgi:hypothetical protein